jgi:hypothetical protein
VRVSLGVNLRKCKVNCMAYSNGLCRGYSKGYSKIK